MLYGSLSASLFPEISFRNKCYFPSNDIFWTKRKREKSQTEEWEEMEQKERNSD